MIAKQKRGPVVVPWTFTNASRAALTTALALVDDPGQVHAVHIADCPPQSEIPIASECRARRQYQECESRFREQFFPHLPCSAKDLRLHFHVVYGRVAAEVASFALRESASLVVLSGGNRWSVSRFVFGSLTTKIVHAAHCPVLVLKGDDDWKIPVRRKKVIGAANVWGGRISGATETD